MRRMGTRTGFVLAEALIASVVLAVALVAISAAFSSGHQQGYYAAHCERGRALAEELARPWREVRAVRIRCVSGALYQEHAIVHPHAQDQQCGDHVQQVERDARCSKDAQRGGSSQHCGNKGGDDRGRAAIAPQHHQEYREETDSDEHQDALPEVAIEPLEQAWLVEVVHTG